LSLAEPAEIAEREGCFFYPIERGTAWIKGVSLRRGRLQSKGRDVHKFISCYPLMGRGVSLTEVGEIAENRENKLR